jgi:hypothetical protein
VLRVDLDAVETLYETGTAPAWEYSGENRVSKQISLADFVPHDGENLRLVARAARRVLAGERPGRIF